MRQTNRCICITGRVAPGPWAAWSQAAAESRLPRLLHRDVASQELSTSFRLENALKLSETRTAKARRTSDLARLARRRSKRIAKAPTSTA